MSIKKVGHYNVYGDTATNTGVDVEPTSTLILAANPQRMYAAIVNDGATDIYLGLGTAAVDEQGIFIVSAGGSFEINLNNLYRGDIYGLSNASADGHVTVVEIE